MKTKSSGAGAMFMKRRALEPELYHFYDGSTALCVRRLLCFQRGPQQQL